MIPLNVGGTIAHWLIGNPVSDAFDGACQKVWNGVVNLLSWSLKIMDKVGTVDVNPSDGHPLAQVYPIMMWIGLAMALGFAFLSIGQFVLTRGRNGAEMLIGFVKFVGYWVGFLSLVALLVAIADELSTAILGAGKLTTWSNVGDQASWLAAGASKDVSPILAALIGILFILPAGCGFLLFAVVRAAGVEIITATAPILMAGLLWSKTAHWMAVAMQWLLTLIFLPVVVSVTVLIGISLMSGVGQDGGLAAIGQLLVGAVTLALSLGSPILLFKLFAFVPPTVASRVSGFGSAGSGSSGSGGSSSSSDAEGSASPQDQMQQSNMARVQSAGGMMSGAQDAFTGAGAKASDTLESVGVGHSTGQQSSDSDSNDSSSSQGSNRSESDASPNDPNTAGPASDTNGQTGSGTSPGTQPGAGEASAPNPASGAGGAPTGGAPTGGAPTGGAPTGGDMPASGGGSHAAGGTPAGGAGAGAGAGEAAGGAAGAAVIA